MRNTMSWIMVFLIFAYACGTGIEGDTSTGHDTASAAGHETHEEAEAAPLLAIMQKLGVEMTSLT